MTEPCVDNISMSLYFWSRAIWFCNLAVPSMFLYTWQQQTVGLQHPGHSPVLIQGAGKSLCAGKEQKCLAKHPAQLPVFQSLWWWVCLSSHYGDRSLLSSPCAFIFRRSEQLSRQSLDHKLGCLRSQLTVAGLQIPCWCMTLHVQESGFAGWRPALWVP